MRQEERWLETGRCIRIQLKTRKTVTVLLDFDNATQYENEDNCADTSKT